MTKHGLDSDKTLKLEVVPGITVHDEEQHSFKQLSCITTTSGFPHTALDCRQVQSWMFNTFSHAN